MKKISASIFLLAIFEVFVVVNNALALHHRMPLPKESNLLEAADVMIIAAIVILAVATVIATAYYVIFKKCKA